MVYRTKLVDEGEFRRWYEEGRTYAWIVQRYREKYQVEIGAGTISNWRHALGLPKRQARNMDLIPWAVKREHRLSHTANMLHAEGRRRAGLAVDPTLLSKLEFWKLSLAEQDAVVHYDPDTEQGWWIVPRRKGIDKDLIRTPAAVTRERHSRE